MTTLYAHGRFWVIDSLTLKLVPDFPSFGTIREALEAIGDRYQDPMLEG